MKKWLTSLLLLFAFASGVLAGTPVFSGSAKNDMSAMKCCKKKTKDCGIEPVSAAKLCCVINCDSPVPTSPSASFNFSPSVIISDSILKQIIALIRKEKPVSKVSFSFEGRISLQKFQPKYIRHHSFLI